MSQEEYYSKRMQLEEQYGAVESQFPDSKRGPRRPVKPAGLEPQISNTDEYPEASGFVLVETDGESISTVKIVGDVALTSTDPTNDGLL